MPTDDTAMPTEKIPHINMHAAKTHLSRLIEDVKNSGQAVIIAKAGKPQVKIVPLRASPGRPRFGFLKNLSTQSPPFPEDFDRLHETEIAALFAGEQVEEKP
ncbi:MAG: type II toxin-antitoxin system Phd/YefM family antitoxin [Lautropia sp.]|nr:type II toxin-antitoxin system Phd/YefM family antitoxin [Lautropia sp.]